MRYLFSVMILLLGAPAFAQSLLTTADVNNPFSKMLISQYQNYRKVGLAGDIPSYLKTRTSEVSKEISGSLTSEKLKRLSKLDFDPAEYRFIRVEARTKSARTLWEKRTEGTTTYQLVKYRLENGEWKIGETLESINIGDMSKVPGPTGLEQLLQHRHGQLID